MATDSMRALVLGLALLVTLRKPLGFSYAGQRSRLQQPKLLQRGNQVLPSAGLSFGQQRSAPYGASWTSVALGIVSLITMGAARKNNRNPAHMEPWEQLLGRNKKGFGKEGIKRRKCEIRKLRKKNSGGYQPVGCDHILTGTINGIGRKWKDGEHKRMYNYYVNKMYKVFPRPPYGWVSKQNPPTTMASSSSTLEMAPTTNSSEFVSPSLWNKPFVRAAAVVSGGAVAGGVLPFAAMMHLSAFGVWLGTNVWTTFVAGLTMFKTLPRQQFGSLQTGLARGSCSTLPVGNLGEPAVSRARGNHGDVQAL